MIERNKPLAINFRIIDAKTDEEEKVVTYNLRKIDLAPTHYKYEMQKKGLDRKKDAIIDMIIWAANNGKVIEVINVKDDSE